MLALRAARRRPHRNVAESVTFMGILVHVKDRAGQSYLMEWISSCDAPNAAELWDSPAFSTDPRMDRVLKYGSSLVDGSNARSVIFFNRAGDGETTLTYDQMIDFYCTREGVGPMPTGVELWRMPDDAGNDWYQRNWPHDLRESTFAEPDPYVEARQGVAVAVVRDGVILLGKRLNCIGSGEWQMPGGKPEPGELLEQAAVRELREETGLVAVSQQYAGSHVAKLSDGVFLRTHYFLVDALGVPMNVEPDKCDGWEWQPIGSPPSPMFASNARAIGAIATLLAPVTTMRSQSTCAT